MGSNKRKNKKGVRYANNESNKTGNAPKKKQLDETKIEKQLISQESTENNESKSDNRVLASKKKLSIKQAYILLGIFFLIAVVISLVVILINDNSNRKEKIRVPDNLVVSNNYLKWDKVENANYYILSIDGEEIKVTGTQYSVNGFLPKSYGVCVCAVKDEKNKSEFSEIYNFTISKQEITVNPVNNIIIFKGYDGNNTYSDNIVLGKHYTINKSELKYGYDVDISITDCKFNSCNVWEADSLIVEYSAQLTGADAANYCIGAGSFSLKAELKPKEIKAVPKSYVKQFAESENLTTEIYDEDLNKSITVKYIREQGEAVGVYDIVNAESEDLNYTVLLEENSGSGKFEIKPRVIDINVVENAFISKIYDGSEELSVDCLNKELFLIDNTVSGYVVDVKITRAVFNSKDVGADRITIYFDKSLSDVNGVYEIEKSSIEIDGCILPKTIYINPKKYKVEFGNKIDLADEYFDTELNKKISYTFTRQSGEAVGLYDILTAQSDSLNYEFKLSDDSGKNKFEITKRALFVKPFNVAVSKFYDNTKSYNGDIVKGVHYELVGELEEYAVDINILSALYDFPTVLQAQQIIVEFSELLSGNNDIYTISEYSFSIPAKIDKKRINLEPDKYEKQYGDKDELADKYFDELTDTWLFFEYKRTAGETVGFYDIIGITCDNCNYDFNIINFENKFEITKRLISVVPTDIILTKEFDNSDYCNLAIDKNINYVFENIIEGEEPEIRFSKRFNGNDVNSDFIILDNIEFNKNGDRYRLSSYSLLLPSRIIPKQVTVEPQYFSVQYGDVDYLRQTYSDNELGLTFGITFIRETGDLVGDYDIISATPDNVNYEIQVINGEKKYQISPRVLGIEKIGNPTFNKIYDGTTDCVLPIKQGVHYNLTNLIGGSNVTLNILNQEYNSKNVTEATKVIVRYTAILDGADGGQFITAGGTMEFDAVITPREISVTPDLFEKDYLSELDLKQNITDMVSGDIITVTYASSAGEDHTLTECGEYDILDLSYDDDNHILKIADGAGDGKFIINRINLVINASSKNTVYNSKPQGINAPWATPSRELKVSYKIDTEDDGLFTLDLPVFAGYYTVRITFDGDRNYLPQYVDRNLYIERAESIITNTTPVNYVYDGKVKPLTATLNHNEAELVFSRNNYFAAGTYNYIMISVPQSKNYKSASIIVSLTISKKAINNSEIIYPLATSITYGQYLRSSVLTGGSDMGTFDWDNADLKPQVSERKFVVNFTPKDMDNYDWSNVDMQRYVDVIVRKFKVSEIIFPTSSGVVYTNPLSTAVLDGTSEYGKFEWQNKDFVPQESGYYNMLFKPYDENNYDFTLINKIKQVYVEVSYRTFFQTNGGSAIEAMIVPVINSEPFTYREGYAFDGWFLDEMLSKRATFPLTIDKDTVLYAAWFSEGLIFISHGTYYSVKLDASTIESNVFIPSEHKGLPVKSIENEGFKNCTALEVIVIPSSVISIGHYAFVGCVNLAFVQIINGIENINFGKDWIETDYVYGTDVNFNAESCPECDGTVDFHQPECLYNQNIFINQE